MDTQDTADIGEQNHGCIEIGTDITDRAFLVL